MGAPLLPTSLVGSYSQPDWLIDRAVNAAADVESGHSQQADQQYPGSPILCLLHSAMLLPLNMLGASPMPAIGAIGQ